MGSKLFDLLQLFRAVLPTRNMEELEQRLARAQERNDLPALAKIYYDMGVHCMKNDDPNRAMMYLSRSDTIFSSRDDVYDQVSESLCDDCSERIGKLEEMPLLTNEIPARLEEQAELFLDDLQIRLWGLMTMARLVRVGERLSKLPGCEVLGNLGQAVDLILRSLQERITQEEFQFLVDTCNRLYELGDDECFSDMTQQVEVPGGMPIQAFDLNGLLVLTELNLYLDSHLRLLTQGQDNSEAEMGLVPCALLPDYYLRTCGTDLSQLPQISQETARIQDDYGFVRSKITWDDINRRIAQYKELDILTCK
ncbi:MAG: hypothetical protein NC305_11815 [Lachnospiraceae bacterium]|nr:hypothetical protein [Butyrivibrio sp.]MCM1344656.1 hypothetical protein [Muribaculaceae bacterium]MCM1411218.1 hypothetical protein [Lachnospiraceae bacterium]